MGAMEFQRARSDEQRAQRRSAILETAAGMLSEMTVAKLSLNELSRRVGLAKSNVLRYFESREAILLQLLDRQIAEWTDSLAGELGASDQTFAERVRGVAAAVATSLAARPVMCDLVSAQNTVLEQNISTAVAIEHKRAAASALSRAATAIHRVLDELSEEDCGTALALTLFLVGSAWPHSHPGEALRAAYESDPEIAATRWEFEEIIARSFEVTALGLSTGDGE